MEPLVRIGTLYFRVISGDNGEKLSFRKNWFGKSKGRINWGEKIMGLSYLDIAIKLTMGLLSLVLVINISGKGNLAPSSAMDQVLNYVLGELSEG